MGTGWQGSVGLQGLRNETGWVSGTGLGQGGWGPAVPWGQGFGRGRSDRDRQDCGDRT